MKIPLNKITVILFFLAFGIALFGPALTGKVPFAADVVLQFPQYESNPDAHQTIKRHAELGDTATQLYPWRTITQKSLRQGEIPLWNPYILAGTPFQANGQSALFYPPHWIFHLFPLPIAWTISLILKIVLLGFFTYLFAHSIGCSPGASVCAGIVLSLSGFFWSWLPWETVDSALWLPLMCYAVNRLHKTGRGVILTGFSFAMPVLAGHPETAMYVVGLASAFALFLFFDGFIEKNASIPGTQFLLLFCASAATAMGFAAVQLIPTLEWLRHTDRSLAINWPPLPLNQAFAFLSRDYSCSPNISGIWIPLAAGYAGALTLLGASLSWLFPKRRIALWFILVAVISFAGIYGLQPMRFLLEATPVFQGLKRERMLLLLDFALAMLCAMGLTKIEKESEGNRRILIVVSSLAFFFTAFFSFFLKNNQAHGGFLRSPKSIFLFLAAAFLLIACRAFGRIRPSHFAAASIALLAIDLGTCALGTFPFTKPEAIFPKAPVYEFLRNQPPPFRVIPVDDAAGVNFEQMYKLHSANGFDIMLKRIKNLTMSVTNEAKDTIKFRSDLLIAHPNRIIDMLNVKYLLATEWNPSDENLRSHPERFMEVFREKKATVLENKNVLDFGIVVPLKGIEVIADDQAQVKRIEMPEFNPRASVILPEMPQISSTANASDVSGSELSNYERRMNSFSFTIEAPYDGILVVSEMHYPGWKVFIDGHEEKLLRANYAFMGASIAKGTHAVRFVFRPASFYAGLIITIFFVLAAAGLGTRKFARSK